MPTFSPDPNLGLCCAVLCISVLYVTGGYCDQVCGEMHLLMIKVLGPALLLLQLQAILAVELLSYEVALK